MPRITIKGGIWRNTEDEILKAAIMKYGKNQWARIASLLHRKSAKQCKARWSEWLDPSIKKIEWSQEEEEKLLHLAKMLPTQWRTIAPLVGRTATQCLERYEYLLDKAQQKDQDFGEDDPRKLKPGEIDPNPETKPARPDPKDMDEDELEMLSEARARLANTQGKKAKRKAREKQLEEARRLAALQKRRELRAAGIHLREGGKKRKRGIDYMNEIPFEKKPLPGFYDTSNEVQVPEANFRGQRIDNETRRSIELKERKKDKEKLKKKKEQDLPNAILDDKFLEPARKRSKLVLPEPQISDRELEEIIKIGKESEVIKKQAEENGGASQVLLNDYSLNAAEKLANLRTPRVPDTQNSILNEARDIMALTNVNTPLLGGENTPLISHSFDAVGKQVLSTPNTVLGTPFRTPALKMGGGETPGSTPSVRGKKALQTPLRTPMRDGYNLNANEEFEVDVDEKERKVSLKMGFESLPAPKDVEIVFSMDEEEGRPDVEEEAESAIVEDQAEMDRMREERLRKERELEMMSRSQVVQRQLPRPTIINDDILRTDDGNMTDLQKAEELIKAEMLIMQHYDNMKDLPKRKGMTTKQLQQQESLNIEFLENQPYEAISADDLEEARELLRKMVEHVREKMAHGDVTFDIYDHVRDQCLAQLLFIPSANKFTRNNMSAKKDKIESLEKRLENNKKVRDNKAKAAAKLEKRHKTLVLGYQTKAQDMSKQLRDLEDQMEQASIERYTFNRLREQEREAIDRRLNSAKEDVYRQTERHNDLQKKFMEMVRKREDLMEKLNKKSELQV